MSAQDKLAEIEALRKGYEERLAKESKAIVGEVFKEIFDSTPGIKSICWSQYTPYFNDGEPCEFGVNDFYSNDKEAGITHDPEDDGWEHLGYVSKHSGPSKGRTMAKIAAIPQSVFLAAFGDHVTVTATASGFETEEYEHE